MPHLQKEWEQLVDGLVLAEQGGEVVDGQGQGCTHVLRSVHYQVLDAGDQVCDDLCRRIRRVGSETEAWRRMSFGGHVEWPIIRNDSHAILWIISKGSSLLLVCK